MVFWDFGHFYLEAKSKSVFSSYKFIISAKFSRPYVYSLPYVYSWLEYVWKIDFGATLYNSVGELCTVLDDWCMKKERALLFAFVSDWHDNFPRDVFDFCQTGFLCLLEIPKSFIHAQIRQIFCYILSVTSQILTMN